jgi:hypothetical protein
MAGGNGVAARSQPSAAWRQPTTLAAKIMAINIEAKRKYNENIEMKMA